jgi:hypothetical protein
MNTRSLLLLVTATGALAAPLLFTVATRAGDADPRADADAGSESLDGSADAGPPLPSYRVEPFPEERSAEPGAKEWASAPRVALDRASSLHFDGWKRPPTPDCEARRVREWMRIRCTIITGALALLGGDREGLAMRLDPLPKEEWRTIPEGAEVVFPVRRGDRREIEWLGIEFGYHAMSSVVPAFVLSEQWAPGDDGPMIVAQ